MRRRSLAALLALLPAALPGLPSPPHPEHDVIEQEVVYRVPAMDRVTVKKDVPFLKTDSGQLKLDLSYPPDYRPGVKLPAVVFINGVGSTPRSSLKEWGIYKSWGRLVAASGWIGVTFDSRGPNEQSLKDIASLFAFLRRDAGALGVDPDRVAAWVCSANVTSGLKFLMDEAAPGVVGAVVYYGVSDPAKLRRDLPVFSVRAGRDNPQLNSRIDALWARAIREGAPWTMVNAPASQHAFDGLDETAESRRIVRETLDFFRDLFTPPTAPDPPSLAKEALSHWFGGREYAGAAKAYAEYVRTHPDDGVAWLRLGLSQANLGDPAAAASLEKAAALAGDASDLYDVACGYAILGSKEKALDWLERAVAAGFADRSLLERDPDLANIRDTDRFRKLVATLPPQG